MILLDTHIWLRWLLPSQTLPVKLIEQIELAETVTVSAISCWEIVMLVEKQRIKLTLPVEQWLKEASVGSGVDVLPITCNISCLAGTLPKHHKDPADHIIIATALYHNLKLMSLDKMFPIYRELTGHLV